MVFMHMVRGKEYWATPEKYAELKNRDKKAHVDWRSENKEIVSQRNKAWREANPEKARDNLRKWISKNRERSNQHKREWNKRNPNKVKLTIQKRKEKDLDGYNTMKRMASAKRRAIKFERLHPNHDFEIERVLSEQCKSLYNRFGIKFEVDHIVPLAEGGWHHHLNLHVIPMAWNRRKHTKGLESLPECWNPLVRC